MSMFNTQSYIFIALILLGTLFEAIYMLRWFGYATRLEAEDDVKIELPVTKLIPIAAAGLSLIGLSYWSAQLFDAAESINFLPLFFAAAIFIIDFIPGYVKNVLTIGAMGYYAYTLYPSIQDDYFKLIFAAIFLVGGIITLIPGFSVKGKRLGFYPLAIIMFGGLIGLVEAKTTLEFFFSWELMALSSYLLILRGKKSMGAAYQYILFSLGGAYLMFAGFGLMFADTGNILLESLANVSTYATYIYIFLGLGFLFKLASIGLHIWLPGSYAEAEDDVTPMLSGVLMKSGVYGLFITLLYIGGSMGVKSDLAYILGWIGALTAVGGNMLAVFQEDVKKLVAYSSIGVMGYIVFALAMMSHMGWLTAVTYTINHVLYKTLIFLAVGGVLYRVKSRNIYEMGGLIKSMPFSFISVLIGIIALAGVPPLTGFAGKWLFYNAVIEKGWYLQGVMVFFSGIVAFMYCFKLIHSVFLGQQKDHLRKVKEAPIWYIIPQMILIIGIMVFSMYPKIILEPIGLALGNYFPEGQLTWNDTTASSLLGYWDAWKIGQIVIVMFAILFIWLFIMSRKAQKIKQFDIAFAGEKPFRPETTHVSYNMFAHYNKALGFMVLPYATKFWNGATEVYTAVAGQIRKIYNGNGQTYALHIIMFILLFYFVLIR